MAELVAVVFGLLAFAGGALFGWPGWLVLILAGVAVGAFLDGLCRDRAVSRG